MFLRFLLLLLVFIDLSYAVSVKSNIIKSGEVITLDADGKIFAKDTLYTHKPLITCMPNIDAVYKYISKSRLEIIPKEPLPTDTSYSCSLDTQYLIDPKEELSFGFDSEGLKLIDWHYIAKERLLRVVFNDTIDTQRAKEAISIYKLHNLAQTKLHYKISTDNSRTLLLQITEEVGDNLRFEILPSSITTSNNMLNEKITQNIDHSTATIVKLNEKISPMEIADNPIMEANSDGSFSIVIFTNDTFDDYPIKESIEIDGIGSFEIERDIYLGYHKREEVYHLQDSYYATRINSREFQANTHYRLTLKKGLRDYRELKEDKVFEFTTGDRKRGVVFDSSKPYLSSLGELGFATTNISKATLVLERITRDNYRYFINYHKASTKEADRFTKEIFAKDISLDNPHNQIQKQKISLKELIDEGAYGVYRVSIDYEDRDIDDNIINARASKVIFVSDIGITLNLSNDQAFVSLLKLSDKSPLNDALVEIYSANNILIASTKSDKDGIAIIEQKSLLSKEPKAIIVTTSDDKSFLFIDKSLNSITKKALKSKQNRYRASIYFQSNIIRPASTLNAMITLKDRDFISASSTPIRITLSQLYEEPILDEVYSSDELGIINFSYKFSHEDSTGVYILKVYIGDELIGKKRISVEAFLPPKIENHIHTDRPIYRAGEYIETNISSSYLFGAPSSMLDGVVRYSATGSEYKSKKFDGYSFENSLLDSDNEELYIDISQNIRLDSQGRSSIILPTTTTQKVPSILEATIEATIMDDTQPVATYKSIFIYPYRHLVGIKVAKNTIESGKEMVANIVLIDPITQERVEGKVSVVIKKQNWHYSYSSGHYNWESEVEVIDSFSVDANGEFRHTIKENGEYIIEVIDRLGGHSATDTVDVSGWGYSNISPKANLKSVDISFENRLYKKGDSIKVSLKSPILDGRILLLLEGDRVYWHKSIEVSRGSAVVDVPIEVDMKRGLYLHAIAIRDTHTLSTLIPFRAMGYKFVKPNREDSRIDISLDYNHTTPSNTKLPLNITTDREVALLVSVVDKGILNLVDQKIPEIFDYFNQQPNQKILYYDIYEKVMNSLREGNIISFGSDMDSKKRKKHLPPENEDRVKPFMLWSDIIYTKDKKATFEMEIPEFSGKASIVVIALDNRSIGVKGDDIVVKDDIIIKPSYPRFILVGDRVEVPIRVFNTTSEPKSVRLTHTITPNLSISYDDKEMSIRPNKSTLITATLEANSIGKGEVVLKTLLDNHTFSRSVTLLAMSPYALQSKSYQNTTSSSTKIDIPPIFEGAEVLINLSDNILGRLYGDLKYLVRYPYGCAEQTSSKISAMFYAKPFMREGRLLRDSDHFIQQGIKKLSYQQNGYGEFGYWEASGYVDPYASLYASETLLDMNASGYDIDSDVKKRIVKALTNIIKAKSSLEAKYDNPLRVYAGYILSTHNLLDNTLANMLYDNKIYSSYYISYYYMAVILKNMGRDSLAKDILTKAKLIQDSNYARAFASPNRDLFLISSIKSRYFDKKDIKFQSLIDNISKLYSTHTKALAFKAISSYLGRPIDEKMRVALHINGDKKIYQNSTTLTQKLSSNHISIEPLEGIVNYSVEVYKHLPYPIKNQLTDKKSISIKQEFIDSDGYQVDLKNIAQGSEIYSKITVENMKSVDNLVLNQRIPACFDIVNSRINSSKVKRFADRNLYLDHKDIRDDRLLYFFGVDGKSKREVLSRKPYRSVLVAVPEYTTIYTPLIATTIGECNLPALTIEAMYDSRIKDYAKERQMVVVKSKENIVAKAQLSSNDIVKNLVRELYRLEESNARPEESLGYFHFPLKGYFGRENLTADDILQNKSKNNQEWSKKRYSIKEIVVVDEDKALQRYRVKIVFDYTLDNGKKILKGTSSHLLTIIYRDGVFGVESIELYH
jgi:uncharacterized protein YfaS (alpha-2-macroglobulin family)